jgi:hypothetical protein
MSILFEAMTRAYSLMQRSKHHPTTLRFSKKQMNSPAKSTKIMHLGGVHNESQIVIPNVERRINKGMLVT